MLHSLFQRLDQVRPIPKVSAHCDIPCGIYDPTPAQIYALSVLRYCQQIEGLDNNLEDQAKLGRLIADKEKHAEAVKHEVRIIWGDYFKGDLLKKYPDIHNLAHDIMLAGSVAKQSISSDTAKNLVSLMNDFTKIFWESKGIDTYRAACPYEPKVDTVYPKLG